MPKKLLAWSAVAFAGFYLFTQPANAADAVGGAFSGVAQLFDSIIVFLTALFN